MIAALFVETNGVYFNRSDVDPWDLKRDARLYSGPYPVVAHPPCGPWSSLAHLSQRPQDKDLFAFALEAVRKFGGVLEHPAYSRAFAVHGIKPTMQVDQCDFGHPARKRTWLYIYPADLRPGPLPPPREPTHWCSGVHTKGARGETPPGIKVCSAQQRRRTPKAFADWLISLAEQAQTELIGSP